MAATHASPALFTAALVDTKSSADGLGGDVGLELFVDIVILGDFAAAIGTGFGQRRFEGFGDRFGRRRRPMGVLAVPRAGLATGLFRPRLGLALGERSGLPLAGAFLLVESPFEIGDAS